MHMLRSATRSFTASVAVVLSVLVLGGCIYQVPITPEPTRSVEERLLGAWVSQDGKNTLEVRRLSDNQYSLSLNNLSFRAHHSDVAGTPLGSIQEIDSRKYSYVTWALSDDGRRLRWRAVSRKIVPDDVADSAAVQELIRKNLDNPALYEAEQEYARKK